MKGSIQFEGSRLVKFYKHSWTEEDLRMADCFDMNYDGSIVTADIRLTWKKPMNSFIKQAFPYMGVRDPEYVKSILRKLSSMYKVEFKAFEKEYGERYDYSRVNKQMRAYQVETMYRCIHSKYKLLALDMGLGKSLTSATISKVLKCRRTAIVGPAISKWNWFGDMTDSWGYNKMNWTILDAQQRNSMIAIKERFVVINYEILKKHDAYLNKSSVDHFIFDECHRFKNTGTATFKNVHKLTKKHPNAKLTALSGTPWTNRVTDLFAYLRLFRHPLGVSKKAFEDEFALKSGSKVVGVKNIERLNLLLSNVMIRLKSDDVLDLPKLSINKAFFNVGDLENQYMDVLNELKGIREEYEANPDMDSKDKFQYASKISNSISSISRITALAKVDSVVDWAKGMEENGEKVVIFSSWRSVLEELEEKLGKDRTVRVDGSVNSKKKMELVDRFKDAKEDIPFFLGQVRAAGEVINLQNARIVMFMDVPVSPKDIEQPVKRCHRSGQERPVFAYFSIAKGSIDEKIYNIITNKTRDINAVIDADSKKGVVDYGNLEELLFKELTN